MDNKTKNYEELLDTFKNVLKYSVKAIHPQFHNQLFGGVNQYALAGEFISTATNGSMHIFEMASVYTMMENECIRQVAK